jgi:hypothetical protein
MTDYINNIIPEDLPLKDNRPLRQKDSLDAEV